ncbi:hypothetical protein, partial [Escherichia coli]|uniref:hypothetical protein n=1 Tax=Escherichia coli TaxID=562 RepID=UPI001BDD45F3
LILPIKEGDRKDERLIWPTKQRKFNILHRGNVGLISVAPQAILCLSSVSNLLRQAFTFGADGKMNEYLSY